jgi:tryptophan-rich sensory protein
MNDSAPSRTWLPLAGFIGAAFAAGAVGSWATFTSVGTWYPLLQKPSWNPPPWLFGPVWTLLYVLMGVAAWRAWRTGVPAARRGAAVFVIQLGVNALWSVLFFGLRQPAWALGDIAALWLLLAWLQVRFSRADRWAGILWLPYLLWVTFAAFLNAAIVRLN